MMWGGGVVGASYCYLLGTNHKASTADWPRAGSQWSQDSLESEFLFPFLYPTRAQSREDSGFSPALLGRAVGGQSIQQPPPEEEVMNEWPETVV